MPVRKTVKPDIVHESSSKRGVTGTFQRYELLAYSQSITFRVSMTTLGLYSLRSVTHRMTAGNRPPLCIKSFAWQAT